jgi:hypothetical protein
VRDEGSLVEELIPPAQTMGEMAIYMGPEYKISKQPSSTKRSQLKALGLMMLVGCSSIARGCCIDLWQKGSLIRNLEADFAAKLFRS